MNWLRRSYASHTQKRERGIVHHNRINRFYFHTCQVGQFMNQKMRKFGLGDMNMLREPASQRNRRQRACFVYSFSRRGVRILRDLLHTKLHNIQRKDETKSVWRWLLIPFFHSIRLSGTKDKTNHPLCRREKKILEAIGDSSLFACFPLSLSLSLSLTSRWIRCQWHIVSSVVHSSRDDAMCYLNFIEFVCVCVWRERTERACVANNWNLFVFAVGLAVCRPSNNFLSKSGTEQCNEVAKVFQ